MLSICIPTLNRAKLLKKNLDVLLGFNKLDIEVNISNNGSDDNTLEVIKEYQNKFDKFNYVSFENTVDIVTNFDSATRLATQKYVFTIPDDDNSLEDGLMAAVDMLEQNQDILAVYAGYKEYSLDEQFLVDTKKCDTTEIYSQSNRLDLINKHWSFELPVFRNSFYQSFALIHENSSVLSWTFVDAILNHGNIAVTPYFFFKHYIHSDRFTEKMGPGGHFNNLCLSEVEIFLAKTNADQQAKIQVLKNTLIRSYNFNTGVCIRNNNLIQARYFICRGLLYHPEHFAGAAANWDKQHLVRATVEEIKSRIEVKTYVSRVSLISEKPEELTFLMKMFADTHVDEVLQLERLEQLNDYDVDSNYIIYFDEEQLIKHARRHNVVSFQQLMNALKFTEGKIILNLK